MDQYIAVMPCKETGGLTAAHIVVSIDTAYPSIFPLYGNDRKP